MGIEINEIPSYSLKPLNGNQSKLKIFEIYFSQVRKLDKYAFYNLDSLTHLTITRGPIDCIHNNAFEFKQESKDLINIYLDNNHNLNGSSFAISTFQNFRRPAVIHLLPISLKTLILKYILSRIAA